MHIVLFLGNQRQLVAIKEQKKKMLIVRKKPSDYLTGHLQSLYEATTNTKNEFWFYLNLPCL